MGAVLVVVKFSEGQLGGSDCRADELSLAAFVEGSKQKLSCGIVNDLELASVFKDVL